MNTLKLTHGKRLPALPVVHEVLLPDGTKYVSSPMHAHLVMRNCAAIFEKNVSRTVVVDYRDVGSGCLLMGECQACHSTISRALTPAEIVELDRRARPVNTNGDPS